MARKDVGCREYPSETMWTIAISTDSVDELVEAAAQHAVALHKHQDTPGLQATLRSAIREGSPS